MNHKKRLAKQRLARVKDRRAFYEYLNSSRRTHFIFKMFNEGEVAVDRIIEKKDSVVIKAHYVKTKRKILMNLYLHGHAIARIE